MNNFLKLTLIIGVALSLGVAFMFGQYDGAKSIYRIISNREAMFIQNNVSADILKKLQIEKCSDGCVYLSGELTNDETATLKEELLKGYKEDRMPFILRHVQQ